MEVESQFPGKAISFHVSESSSKPKFTVDGDMDVCILNAYHGNKCQGDILSESRTRKSASNRINLTTSVSRKRGDTLYETLAPLVKTKPNSKIEYHLTCADKYCLVKQRSKVHSPLPKRQLSQAKFDFKTLRIYCGLDCSITCDEKHKNTSLGWLT